MKLVQNLTIKIACVSYWGTSSLRPCTRADLGPLEGLLSPDSIVLSRITFQTIQEPMPCTVIFVDVSTRHLQVFM